MTKTMILIDHPVGRRDDRASALLAERGYRVEWCCPGKGDRLPEPRPDHVAAIVYGGPESANDIAGKPYLGAEIDWIGRWVDGGRPYLGICLGGQLLARALGAAVVRHPEGMHEIGYVPIDPTPAGRDFLAETLHVYHWHSEGFEVPEAAELLATGPTFPNQAFRYRESAYGLQFHPEVTPEILTRWIEDAGHLLGQPGAHPRARQLADSERFDRTMGHWLRRFLDRWLDGAA